MKPLLALAFDIGTTSVKTCLYAITPGGVTLIASAGADYPLAILPGGGAEQNPDDWWAGMCQTTREVLRTSRANPADIAGISFCSQMQGLVLVDRDGVPVRPAMSYMDQRAAAQMKAGLGGGIPVEGANAAKLLRCLAATKAAPTSVKDPVWKYKWVQQNEPENFARAYKWLDVKEALICRCTGNFVMTRDSAYATLLYDTRKGREGFSKSLCRMLGVNPAHLPTVIAPHEMAGLLTEAAAACLGLPAGTPVFGGGGDAAVTGVGAGAARPGQTYVYVGTSGWVSTAVESQVVDIGARIAAIVGAGAHYNYFAEMETAGKCMEWVRDHLALDEIDIYLDKHLHRDSPEAISKSLYDYLIQSIKDVPPGSRGVVFAPWLHGNRCPFEDENARGVFLGVGIETGKRDMIRAVLEGVCFHLRWMLEAQAKKTALPDAIRFVGGGALAPLTCQILADVTGKRVQTVECPQNVGAVGAAMLVGVGLGMFPTVEDAADAISADAEYAPDPKNRAVYDRNFAAFRSLYPNNKKAFRLLRG